MRHPSPQAPATRIFTPLWLAVGWGSALLTLTLAAMPLGARLPPGNWTAQIVGNQPDFWARFYPFDAQWYQNIATHAYHWNPALTSVKQNAAFFPLWPLLMHAVGGGWAAVALAVCFAATSVAVFYQLAATALDPAAARLATALYALYPGAAFLCLAYPTGLLNLLTGLALLALLKGRVWLAAFCSALATATGPLGLATAATVMIFAASGSRGRAGWRRLAGIAGLSVSGLAGFSLFQGVALHDPAAFLHAQAAWAVPLPLLPRLLHSLAESLVVPDFWGAGTQWVKTAFSDTRVAAQAHWESGLNLAGLGLALIGCLAALRVARGPLPIQALFTAALYIWFDGATRPGHATLRLIYPALGAFIGIAWLLRDRPRLAATLLGVSALLLFCEIVLTAAGYHVV